MLGQQRRPVVLGSVDPTVQEVVVTIRKTLGFEKEILSFFFIELGSCLSAETVVCDVEVSVICILQPVSPFGSLETVGWPIPGVLRLDDIEFAIKAEGHDVMADLGSSSIHDDLVKAVKAHNTEEVT